MSLVFEEVIAERWAQRSPLRRGRTVGPVTRSRQLRSLAIYGLMVMIGAAPWLAGASPALKAAGLGLWFPGAGFIASSGWWALVLTPASMLLFAASLFIWFGVGMVIAPAIVWLGLAAAAGLLAREGLEPSAWPPVLCGLLVGLGAGWAGARQSAARRSAAARRLAREANLAKSVQSALAAAAPEPDPVARELSREDLAGLRYLLDRALQPVEGFDGFDVIDQFQTASLRYQINNCGWALAEIQTHYVPNLRGYYETAQLNLIDKYLQPKVWSYWAWETSWGHLNLVNHDPVGRDNIMLTGWFALHVGMYMLATGDRRFLQPGSLTFRKPSGRAYVHDARDLVDSVVGNYAEAPFCLYPCEPNFAYAACNYIGITGLAAMDAVTGKTHAADLRDRWLANLDAEFTDESGSIIGLRSTYTGFKFPFPGGELGFVNYQETLEPNRAWRMWGVARSELAPAIGPGEGGRPRIRLPGRGFDFGNYGPGYAGAYGAMLSAAAEFGDEALASAALQALDEDGGLTCEGGVRRYAHASNLSNIAAVIGRVRRRGDFRRAVLDGPSPQALAGPMLTGLAYPDVLVAKALSCDGQGLDLVLYPGESPGPQSLRIERLRPGLAYDLTGARESRIVADAQGAAVLSVVLDGRTEVSLRPASFAGELGREGG